MILLENVRISIYGNDCAVIRNAKANRTCAWVRRT